MGTKYPQAALVLEAAGDAFTPFLAFSPAVNKLDYTTNAIESLNYQLRKVTKARDHFAAEDAVVNGPRTPWSSWRGWPSSASRTSARTRRPPPGHRQAIGPARPPRRRPANHGLARSPQELETAYPGQLHQEHKIK